MHWPEIREVVKPPIGRIHFPYQNYLARFSGCNLSTAKRAPQMSLKYMDFF